MKEYHFEKDGYDFDKTIRLDDINEEIKRLKGAEVEDELGDANAFLDAFESERFDAAAEEKQPEAEEEVTKAPPKKGSTPPMPAAEEEDAEDEEEFTLSKRTMGLLAAVAVLACILGFSFVRCGFHAAKTPQKQNGEAYPMLVQTVVNTEELIVYDILEGGDRTLRLTEETEVIDAQGRAVAYGGILEGDLTMMTLAKDGETVLTVDYSDTAIQSREATGVEVNNGKGTLTIEEETLLFGRNAIFRYDGEQIAPIDIEPCDLLELKLYDDVVWAAEVVEFHGYLLVENAKSIKDGELQMDDEEPIPLLEGESIAVREGSHTVTVTGSNIETRKDTLFIKSGEDFTYDLSKAQEKVGVILINANVGDYRLYVNGTLMESPAVLPMGEYDLVILKNGYLEWSRHVELEQDTLTVQAELQQEVQTGTLNINADCEGAEVYINGEKYGMAPMQVNLTYGSYTVQVEKDGYATYRQVVSLYGPSATVYAEMQ